MKKTSSKPQRSAADKAFLESDRATLGDLKLAPWTPQRMIAAQSMGLQFFSLTGEAWSQFLKTDVYAGALRDSAIALWLCTLPEDDKARRNLKPEEQNVMTVEEADDAPSVAYRAAKTWAARRGIMVPNSREWLEAYGKFLKMMNEVSASFTKPKADAEHSPPPDEDAEFPNG